MAADSFLSRWSKRKQESRSTESDPAVPDTAARSVLVTPAAAASSPTSTDAPDRSLSALESGGPINAAQPSQPIQQQEEPAALPPVESLTPESDFRPFMRPDVDPAIRNQAMKSLFRDPHFNVMDMMDVYVDDYSLPDPIPESMLRQMTQSRLLKLFDDLPEEKEEPSQLNPESETEVAAPGDPAVPELGQKSTDATDCPTLADHVANQPQQNGIS